MILCNNNFTFCYIWQGRPEDFAVERQKFFSFKDPLLAGLFFGSCLAHFQTKLRMNAIGFSPSKAVLQHPWLQQLAALPCAYANWHATLRAAALP